MHDSYLPTGRDVDEPHPVMGSSVDIDEDWLREKMVEFFNELGKDVRMALSESDLSPGTKPLARHNNQTLAGAPITVPHTELMVHEFLARLVDTTSTLELVETLSGRTLRVRPAWIRELIRESIQTHLRENPMPPSQIQPKQVVGLEEHMKSSSQLDERQDILFTRLMRENNRLNEQNAYLNARVEELIGSLADARAELHELKESPSLPLCMDNTRGAKAAMVELLASDLRGLKLILERRWIPSTLKKMAIQMITERLKSLAEIDKRYKDMVNVLETSAKRRVNNASLRENSFHGPNGEAHTPFPEKGYKKMGL